MKCCQCEKPAMFLVGPEGSSAPLCLDCNLKYEQMIQIQQEQNRMELNHLADQMEAISGVSGVIPRYPERKTPGVMSIKTGGFVLHNINIKDSTVGVVNTGSIETVDQAVTSLRNQGEQALSEQLVKLTEAVSSNTEVSEQTKSEILDILSALASEATVPKDKRRRGILKPLLTQLSTLLGSVKGLSDMWEQVKIIFERFSD